ncbi:amino acid adenylation domain-containing protein [Kordia sp.]|uniref:amino acid adenylation domain-containing protein n=1 Tax=Kordia sp. TaxID=1965332 RepID=UPI003D296AA0
MNEFINKITTLGLRLEVQGDSLLLKGANGKLSPSEISMIQKNVAIPTFIKNNKSKLIAHLTETVTYDGKINKKDISALYELSPLQEGILFHSLYNPKGTTYKTQFSMEFPDGLNLEAFQKSWEYLIKNHTILRTSFIHDQLSIPVQCVYKETPLTYTLLDFTSYTGTELEEKFQEVVTEERKKEFNFKKPPLMRLTLVKTGAKAIRMIWTKHHILWDGWSGQILMSEFLQAYNAYKNHRVPPVLREDKFEDYIKHIKAIDPKDEKEFWQTYFDGFEKSTLVPFVNNAIKEEHRKGIFKEVSIHIDAAFTNELNAFTKKLNITVNTLLQGVWSLLLATYTTKNDVAFGVTVSGRPAEAKYEKKVGLYINTIPFRATIDTTQTIKTWLQFLQIGHVKAREYQHASISEIKRYNKINDDFFDSILVFRNFPINKSNGEKTADSLTIQKYSVKENNNYPLSIQADLNEKLNIDFQYNSDLISEAHIKMIRDHFKYALHKIITLADEKLDMFNLVSEEEAHTIQHEFNKARVPYDEAITVLDLIQKQVANSPEAIALTYKEQHYTYRELDEISNQLASYLTENYSIKTEDLIGVQLERTEWLIITLLAILKSGAAYVPLDLNYPKSRVKFIAEDTGYKVCVTKEIIADFIKNQANYTKTNTIENTITAKNLAYVIYTSGSTGKPKGVLLEHRNLASFLLNIEDQLGYTDGKSVAATTNTVFDISILEIFGALAHGKKLVVIGDKDLVEPTNLVAELNKNNVEVLQITPSRLLQLKDVISKTAIPSLKHLLIGGEAFPKEVYDNLEFIAHLNIKNVYGPTETTIWSTFLDIKSSTNLSIGKPFQNENIYILNEENQMQPIGVVGHLCIGGDGLARGYLNSESLTDEKFIKHPFQEEQRLYKTGDLAKWMPDGTIEYIGRIDNQIKIRGYRIELGEIETAIQEVATVQRAAVLVKKGKNNHAQLIAFVIGDGEVDTTLITTHLKEKLPAYMSPNAIIQVATFPLSNSGKLDRKALLEQFELPERTYIPPTTIVEHKLAEIWQELLGLERVSIEDDFFLIGGDSILLIRMLTQLKKQLQKTVDLQTIYEYSILKDLAKFIETAEEEDQHKRQRLLKNNEITAVKATVLSKLENATAIEDVYPMRDIQEGMIYEYFKSQDKSVYHDQFVYVVPFIEFDIFEKAFKLVVAKHETLRTAFNMTDFSENYQIVYKEVPATVQYEDISNQTQKEQEQYIELFLQEELKDKFIPHKAPLWRAKIFRLTKNTMVYVFQFHHAIIDGWSLAMLNTELYEICMKLQQDVNFVPTPLAGTNKVAVVESLLEQENPENTNFWQSYLEEYQLLNILSETSVDKNHQEFFQNVDLVAIKQMASTLGIPLKTVFLGSFIYALQLMAYETDITIGLVSNNRPISEDGEKILGCFLNTVPFRVQTNQEGDTWKTYLLNIQKNLDALKTRDRISLQQISAIIGEDPKATSKIFNIGFNFTNFHIYKEMGKVSEETEIQESKPVERNDIELNSYERTNIDFGISVGITGDQLKATFSQKKELNSGIQLEEFVHNYESILSILSKNVEATIDHQEIFTQTTNETLLTTFNNTVAPYQKDKTIVDVFSGQVQANPSKVALWFREEQMTYAELDTASNRLANYILQQKEIAVEDFIGIKLERDEWLIITILAVLKTGCAYVPIDPTNPAERIAFIEADSNCKIIIDPDFLATFFATNDVDETLPKTALTSGNLAYIIYTSGSTGKPKGVLIEHRSVINLIEDLTKTLDFTSEDKSILMINHAFDASVEQLFLVLLNGATVELAPEGFIYDPSLLKARILERGLTHIPGPPSYLNQLEGLETCPTIKRVVTGGEYFPYALAQKINGHTRFFNEYGPTETTVTATVFEFNGQYEAEKVIPIGKPMANVEVYILSKNLQLQAPGVIGEICIGGVGLGRGYLNRPELTAEKFIENPFKKGTLLYRTGDLGKWLPDGNVIFIGRRDNQVKVRGHRIEIEEIEQVLHQTENVKHAIIDIREVNDEKSIVAYIVAKSDVKKTQIKDALAKRLPEYMVPNYYVILEEFPTTFNGKIDRKALPSISEEDIIKKEYVAPRSEDEEKLVKIWQTLLNVEQIGIKDSFFELGGNSLLVLKAITTIQEAFEISIPIDVYFKLMTIENISDYMVSIKISKEEVEEDNYEIFEL